jgi:hypothetical protein
VGPDPSSDGRSVTQPKQERGVSRRWRLLGGSIFRIGLTSPKPVWRVKANQLLSAAQVATAGRPPRDACHHCRRSRSGLRSLVDQDRWWELAVSKIPEETAAGSGENAALDLQYELAIDTQTEKFVEIKQKLTYFLITATVAVTAFLVSFVVDNLRIRQRLLASDTESALVVASSLLGLLGAGSALISLRLEHLSHARHLRYRYQHRKWDDLSGAEQASWDQLTQWAARFLTSAFAGLFLQILLAVCFFVVFFS